MILTIMLLYYINKVRLGNKSEGALSFLPIMKLRTYAVLQSIKSAGPGMDY